MKVVKCLVTSFINYSVTRGRDPPALVNTMCQSFQNVRNYDITNMCYGSNYCHVSPWKPPGMLNKSCVNIYQNPAATVDIKAGPGQLEPPRLGSKWGKLAERLGDFGKYKVYFKNHKTSQPSYLTCSKWAKWAETLCDF